jgi:hypothetical protein
MRYIYSRKQRAAASAFSMILATIVACIFLHFGHIWTAVCFEVIPAVFYGVWTYWGPVRDDATYNPDDPEH